MNDVREHGQLAEDARKTRQGAHALQPLVIRLKKAAENPFGMRLKCRAMVQEMRRSNMEHLIVRPIELRRAHADKRVLQNLLRKGICVFKLLQNVRRSAHTCGR